MGDDCFFWMFFTDAWSASRHGTASSGHGAAPSWTASARHGPTPTGHGPASTAPHGTAPSRTDGAAAPSGHAHQTSHGHAAGDPQQRAPTNIHAPPTNVHAPPTHRHACATPPGHSAAGHAGARSPHPTADVRDASTAATTATASGGSGEQWAGPLDTGSTNICSVIKLP